MATSLLESINVPPWPIVVAVITLILLVLINYFTKDKPLPPGPMGIPFLGYFPFLKVEGLHLQLEQLQRKYGDLFSFTVTGQLYIHLGSVKAMREVYVQKSDFFEERPRFLESVFEGGMLMTEGEPWKVLRKHFIQSLKDCGLTSIKDQNAGPYYDSVNAIVSDLKATKGKPVDITELLTKRCSYIMRKTFLGNNGMTSEELQEFCESYGEMLSSFFDMRYILCTGVARRILYLRSPIFSVSAKASRKLQDILYKIIKRHEATLDENHIRNAIDYFLMERISKKRKGDSSAEHLTDKAFVGTLIQVIGDGISGVAMFISDFVKKLLDYPEEQEKIYQELISVMGPDRHPTIEDRGRVPYTIAFINEAARTSEFFPFIPSLKCTKQTTLRGYRIPKGAITISNFWAAHHHPEAYEDPSSFNPSRFVSSPGKPRPELPVGFGIGKRACIGESFTMMEAFLYLTAIVKNFEITVPPDGATNEPVNFISAKVCLCAKPRHHE